MFFPHLLGALVLAVSAAPCAIVPFSGQVIRGPYAECRAAALEVRFQLTELGTSDDPPRTNVQAFAIQQAASLDACVPPERGNLP